MPASGPVLEPKLNPSAVMEDQDVEMERIVLGPPAFSSPSPHTDMRKSLVEIDQETGTFAPTHEDAAREAAEGREKRPYVTAEEGEGDTEGGEDTGTEGDEGGGEEEEGMPGRAMKKR